MSAELCLVLALLAAAIVVFALARPRTDAVARIIVTLLPRVSALTAKPVDRTSKTLAGFADRNNVLSAAPIFSVALVPALLPLDAAFARPPLPFP